MSLAHIPLDQIHPHTQNPRRTAVADEEMVDSIRALGLLTAVTVAPAVDGAGYTLIGGHRRLDGATKAGLTQVPAIIREDLVTEAQQLEAMLVENLHRTDLTPVEEAAAYEQLTFQGMDVDAIAAATGRKASTIRSRLKLNALADTTRERLHAGDMTLLDAEAMLEFADDPAATAQLEEAAGTSNFQWKVQDLRGRRDRIARNTAKIAEYEELGAKPFEFTDQQLGWRRDTVCPLSWFAGEELRDPAAHDGCLGYHGAAESYSSPQLVCTDASSHAETRSSELDEDRARRESEWERQRAEREAARARLAAASAARVEWLREHFTGLLPVKSHKALADAARAFLPVLISDNSETVDSPTLLRGVQVDPGAEDYLTVLRAKSAYALALPAATPTKVLAGFAGYLAALVESSLIEDPEIIDDLDGVQQQLAVWDWLKKAGYPISDVDKEIRTRLEVRHTEFADEAERAAS